MSLEEFFYCFKTRRLVRLRLRSVYNVIKFFFFGMPSERMTRDAKYVIMMEEKGERESRYFSSRRRLLLKNLCILLLQGRAALVTDGKGVYTTTTTSLTNVLRVYNFSELPAAFIGIWKASKKKCRRGWGVAFEYWLDIFLNPILVKYLPGVPLYF